MPKDEGFILIDNEDGMYTPHEVAERLVYEYAGAVFPVPPATRADLNRELDDIDRDVPEEDKDEHYDQFIDECLDALNAACPKDYMVGYVEDHPGVIAYQKIEDEVDDNAYTPACPICYDMGFTLKPVDLDGSWHEVVACHCAARLVSDALAFARWKSMTQDFLYCRIDAKVGGLHIPIASGYYNPHQIIPLLQEIPQAAKRAVSFDIPNMYDCFATVY